MNKFLKGFTYAINGLIYASRTQLNFRFHLFSVIAVTGAGCYYHIERNEWLWISIAIALVLATELLNTAVEALVDLVSPQYNEKAGIVKDLSAAAVLVTAIFAIVVALFIFLPKISPSIGSNG